MQRQDRALVEWQRAGLCVQLPALPTGLCFSPQHSGAHEVSCQNPLGSLQSVSCLLALGSALKATCGHDPAVASCALGWGLHVFLTFASVGFGWFCSTGFGVSGNAPSRTKREPVVASTCLVLFSLNFPFPPASDF